MKKLLSVISIVLLILVMCSVNALATELNADDSEEKTNKVQQIGSTNTNKASNKSTNTNKATNKTVDKEDNEVETNVVGSQNKTNSNKTNTNTNKTNTSNYNSTTGSGKLPYAGTGTTSVALIAIAFAGSAVYAYKKVTDYNL